MNCIYRFAVFPIRWIRKFRNGTNRRGACAELLFYVAQLYTLYWILCIIHTETYVFQSTALGDIFRPVRRTKCSLVPHTLNEFNGDGRHDTKKPQSRDRKIRRHLGNTRSSQHSPTNSSLSDLGGGGGGGQDRTDIRSGDIAVKLSIAIVYLFDGSKSGGNGNDGGESWSDPLMKRVMRNREEYCTKHGYTLINANNMLDKTRPAAWSKLRAVDNTLSLRKEARPDGGLDDGSSNSNSSGNSNSSSNGSRKYHRVTYDYVVYMDMDVVIMNLEIPLEDFILAASSRYHNSSPSAVVEGKEEKNEGIEAEFLMTEDWKGEIYRILNVLYFFIFSA